MSKPVLYGHWRFPYLHKSNWNLAFLKLYVSFVNRKTKSNKSGRVIKVEIINVETQTVALCRHVLVRSLRSKHKLELNVNTFQSGSLRSKQKLLLYVDTFSTGVLMSKHKPSLIVDRVLRVVINVECSVDINTLHFYVDIKLPSL